MEKSRAVVFLVLILIPGVYFHAFAQPSDEGITKETLVFGVLPVVSAEKLVTRFAPLVEYLEKHLKKQVLLETAPNYTEFVRRTRGNRYDILFTAPHFYYLAQREINHRVIVRVDAPIMQAVIVVPKDSKITSLQDLRGKQLATVDPISLATVLVRDRLLSAGLDPDKDLTLVATPSHNASLLSAYKEITDAASLMGTPLRGARKEVRESVRILAKTAGTPHMPISLAPTISASDAKIIAEIFVSLKSSKEGRIVLKKIGWPGLVKASPSEYDTLEPLAQQIFPLLQ